MNGDEGHDAGRWCIGCVFLDKTPIFAKVHFYTEATHGPFAFRNFVVVIIYLVNIRDGLMCLPSFGRSLTF